MVCLQIHYTTFDAQRRLKTVWGEHVVRPSLFSAFRCRPLPDPLALDPGHALYSDCLSSLYRLGTLLHACTTATVHIYISHG